MRSSNPHDKHVAVLRSSHTVNHLKIPHFAIRSEYLSIHVIRGSDIMTQAVKLRIAA